MSSSIQNTNNNNAQQFSSETEKESVYFTNLIFYVVQKIQDNFIYLHYYLRH